MFKLHVLYLAMVMVFALSENLKKKTNKAFKQRDAI